MYILINNWHIPVSGIIDNYYIALKFKQRYNKRYILGFRRTYTKLDRLKLID